MAEKGMKACRVTITTVADGRENSIVREGEMELSASKAILIYREENAAVRIQLEGETAQVERMGDYTLRLSLVRGKITDGEIGIGGSSGEIQTFSHRIQYSATENSLLVSLRYDLIISGETQKMQLRLTSRYI